MANAILPEQYQDMLDFLKRRGRRDIEETRERRLRPTYQRLGLRSPEVAELEEETEAGFSEFLSGKRAELGVERLRRKESLEDVESARKFQTTRTREEWRNQYRTAGIQIQAQKEAATTAFDRQKELINEQRTYEAEQLKKVKKERQKKSIEDWVKTGLNVATGGIYGSLSNIFGQKGAEGTPGWFSRLLQGGAIGMPALAQIGAQRASMQPFLNLLQKRPQDVSTGQDTGQQFNFANWLKGNAIGDTGYGTGTGMGKFDLKGYNPSNSIRRYQ